MNSPSQAQILRIKVRNPWTYVRVCSLMTLSILLTVIIPYAGDDMTDFFHNNSLGIGIIYAIIVGFIMSIALERNRELIEYASIEINKLRHLYHLCQYIAETDVKFKPWMEQMTNRMREYLCSFEGKHLKNYAESNGLFRTMTRTIYTLPQIGKNYPSELYQNLIETTSAIAGARQHIREKVNFRVGAFQWTTLIVVSLSFSTFLLLGSSPDILQRSMSGLLVFNVFLVLDLLYEYDGFKEAEMTVIANYYHKNLKDMGLAKGRTVKKAKRRTV